MHSVDPERQATEAGRAVAPVALLTASAIDVGVRAEASRGMSTESGHPVANLAACRVKLADLHSSAAVCTTALQWTKPRASDGWRLPAEIAGQRLPVAHLRVVKDKTLPCPVPAPADHATNPRFLFLREIGVDCLRSFLQSLILANEQSNFDHPHWDCTLVIDQKVELDEPLVLPAHFTLAGLGINGAGQLIFSKSLGGKPAITMQQKVGGGLAGYTTIRDISIQGTGERVDAQAVWINEPSSGHISLQRVFIYGFQVGIVGDDTSSVTLTDCVIDNNEGNVMLGINCDEWRIRGCHIRNAHSSWAILVVAALKGLLVTGCRFENNTPGAIRLGGLWGQNTGIFGVVIMSNRFESNLGPSGAVGVSVGDGVQSTRILFNMLSDDEIRPPVMMAQEQFSTQIGFNSSANSIDERIVVPEVK